MQSPASKGFLNIKKMNSDKKSPKVAVQAISSSRNYFWKIILNSEQLN